MKTEIGKHNSNVQDVIEQIKATVDHIKDGDQLILVYIPKEGNNPPHLPKRKENGIMRSANQTIVMASKKTAAAICGRIIKEMDLHPLMVLASVPMSYDVD